MDSMIINTNNMGWWEIIVLIIMKIIFSNLFSFSSNAYQFKEDNTIIGSYLIQIINYPKRRYLNKMINYQLYNKIWIILLIFICISLFKNSFRKFFLEIFNEKEN